MLYEFKLKVNKVNEKGDEKEVTEQFIADVDLFCQAEQKGLEMYASNNMECDVFAISRSKIREIVNEKQDDEFFYKVTLIDVFVDDKGNEKATSTMFSFPQKTWMMPTKRRRNT